MKKILIIKTGLSETFVEHDSTTPSLGDVLRSTVLLAAFADAEVSWLASTESASLLSLCSGISHLVFDFTDVRTRAYDIIVNLETDRRALEVFRASKAKEKFGFINPERERLCGSVDQVWPALILASHMTWQEGLYRLIGREWRGEEYGLSAEPEGRPQFDVGLNWAVGAKWPTKSWRKESWKKLSNKLSSQKTVSWQQGFDSIEEYVEWISSCRTVITHDSLGLHLALALKKKVVAIFGPTPREQVYLYGRGLALRPPASEFPCAPCWKTVCPKSVTCMDVLSVNEVYAAYAELEGK